MGRQGAAKRIKENVRLQRQLDKAESRAERRKGKKDRAGREPGAEDPDIAGIVPGPQPLPAEEE